MERPYIVYNTDIERCKRMYLVNIVCSPVFTSDVRDTSASSFKHLIFPLGVCYEIVPDNSFGVVILFNPISSMKTNDANPEHLVVRCVLFAYGLYPSVSMSGPLRFPVLFCFFKFYFVKVRVKSAKTVYM